MVLVIAGMWKTFAKAGKPGWACLIPIYNLIVLLEIAGKELWWIILLFIPVVNFVILILVSIAVAEKFGKGAGFGLGLAFLPMFFFPLLGFGDAQYQG
ncbi:MAG: signal peptidase I [Acidobacteria bacterium]|nr:MAG: signal peptidase I [Acidobacteriota bacterium]